MVSHAPSPDPSGEAAPAPLHIDITRPDGDTVLVALAGEADVFNAHALRQALLGAIDTGAANLVVDLDRLTFMDASTLDALATAHRRIVPSGGDLRVRCHNRRNRRLLSITGLEGLLEQS